MRLVRILGLIFTISLLFLNPQPVGQQPAPVENVSSFPAPNGRRRAESPPRTPGFRNPARGIRARDQQAAEPRFRRPRPALGHQHRRVSLPRQGGHSPARFGQDPLGLRRRRPRTKGGNLRRRLEHSDRALAAAVGKRRDRPQHPQHLLDEETRTATAGPIRAKSSTVSSASATRTG